MDKPSTTKHIPHPNSGSKATKDTVVPPKGQPADQGTGNPVYTDIPTKKGK